MKMFFFKKKNIYLTQNKTKLGVITIAQEI